MDETNPLPRHPTSALTAAAAFSHQLHSDRSFDLEVKEDNLLASTRKERAEVKVRYGKKAKFLARVSSIKESPTKTHHGSLSSDPASSTSMVISTSSHQPGLHHAAKKGLLCLATVSSLTPESDGSDLTPLSSSTMTSPIDDDAPKLLLCTPPKVVPLAARRGFEYSQLAELNEPAWSANGLGSYVWVLLEPKSNHVYDPDRDENDCKERLWWPAKVCTLSSEGTMFIQTAIDPGHKEH